MSWGIEPWGITPWGGPGALAGAGPQLVSLIPVIVDVRGGDVITLTGSGFLEPIDVEILNGDPSNPDLVGRGYISDPEFDLKNTEPGVGYKTILVGTPAVPAVGTYHVRVRSSGTLSNVLADALDYRVFSEEYKVHRARTGFAAKWRTGFRLLTRAKAGGL